jgi:PAS domain S-box-containing protein
VQACTQTKGSFPRVLGSTLFHNQPMLDTSGRNFASRTAEGTTDLRILGDIPLAVTVHDAVGDLVYANEAATRDLGLRRQGQDPGSADVFEVYDDSGNLLSPERLPGRVALTGEPTPGAVLRFRNVATGDERWVTVTAWPVLDEAGTIRFGVSVFTDVTRRHEREETLVRRLAFQSDASETLASSLDYATISDNVARLAVPYLADWCIVYVLQRDGSVRRLAMEHLDPSRNELAKVVEKHFVLNLSSAEGVPKVLRTGRPELHPDATPELLAADVFEADRLAELLRPLGIRSWMCVPLLARGRILGAISFLSTDSRRRYGPDDLEQALDLGRRASTAMDNARLYEERSHIARTLQHSLLPPQLPDIPGIEIAARYRPTGEGNEVGGDFYDLFERAEGDWAIVMGDVCGKGADAAALTGLSRHTIRAAAMQHRDPSTVLSMLNEAIILQDTGRFCTVAYARLEPAGNRSTGRISDDRFQAGMLGQLLRAQLLPENWVAPHARITIGLGGHPLPYVVRREGPVEVVGAPGTLIGIYPDIDLTDVEVTLGPGDALVLYTDGVSEEPDPSGVGETMLDGVLRECIGLPASAIAERIERAAVERQLGSSRDDIAILVVRIEP